MVQSAFDPLSRKQKTRTPGWNSTCERARIKVPNFDCPVAAARRNVLVGDETDPEHLFASCVMRVNTTKGAVPSQLTEQI